MYIEEKFGQLIAQTTRSTIGSVDAALKDNIHLLNTLIEVSEVSHVPLKIDQPIYEQCSNTIVDILSARRNITRLVRSMNHAQEQGNLSGRTFGCPRGSNDELTKSEIDSVV